MLGGPDSYHLGPKPTINSKWNKLLYQTIRIEIPMTKLAIILIPKWAFNYLI